MNLDLDQAIPFIKNGGHKIVNFDYCLLSFKFLRSHCKCQTSFCILLSVLRRELKVKQKHAFLFLQIRHIHRTAIVSFD